MSGIKYSDGSNISYSYDDKGNIVAIYENNSLTERYTYDSLNQLVREDSAKSGTTTTYSYDNGGNILETKKYAYAEGELGDVISTNTYTYSDSEWKDLLTAYNGQTITYDEIGNPLS
ncbi:MAG: RHS repeat-associated core domain-containing protein, partial [Clostridiales bacterium]|nr:RHS repeat-associated core domain-containing protein [Clostridiales bacterium]